MQAAAKAALEPFERGATGENPYQIQYELQECMQDLVGIVRTESEMQQALEVIAQLRTRAGRAGIAGHRQYNNGWHTAMDLPNMLTFPRPSRAPPCCARKAAALSFARTFPNKDPEWGKYNIVVRRGARWRNAGGEAARSSRCPPN